MQRQNAIVYTADPAAEPLLRRLCLDCGLEPGETVCIPEGSPLRIPYAAQCSASLALVYGPAEVPSEKYCLPVLRLLFSPEEIRHSLRDAGYDPERTAVVLPGQMLWDPAGDCRAQKLRWFLEEDYASRTEAVAAAAAQSAVIAGPAMVRSAVQARGCEFVPLLPGPESLTLSLARAQKTLAELREKWAVQARITAYMNSAAVGFIEVDRQGKIVNISERARFLLNYRNTMLDGRYVLNIFPQLDRDLLNAALLHGSSVSRATAGKRDNSYLVNIEPVLTDGEPVGAVIALEKVPHAAQEERPSAAPEGFRARYRFSTFAYTSAQFGYVIRQAKMAANTNAPVLIVGEEGTEITQMAQCIHNESRRDRKGYMEIQCDAWSTEYVQTVLFDAAADPTGVRLRGVEVCDGGTIFFNHIDALSPDLQYMVYSLTTGWYSPLNDLRRLPVDVRIIASTNRNLREMVRTGEFREDLYYVLSAVSLNVPPIREREDDKKDIFSYFMERHCAAYGKRVSLSPAALEFLYAYDWPGNVREMDNFSRKIVLAAPGKTVSETFVRELMQESAVAERGNAGAQADGTQTADPAAQRIVDALRRNGGSRVKTAAELGISKATLWRHMQKYGIATDYFT